MDRRGIVVLAVTLVLAEAGGGSKWGYTGDIGPAHWSEANAACDGSQQSPIDLPQEDATYDDSLPADLEYLTGNQDADLNIKNNGHSVGVNMMASDTYLTSRGLDGEYRVLGPHFHWGAENDRGSEHTVDGRAYAMAMHIVSYSTKFDTVVEALHSGEMGAIAVVGVFFEVVPEENPALEPIVNRLPDVRDPDLKVPMKPFDIKSLLPLNMVDYFRYSGSLTTPGCQEVVTWTVMLQPQTMSQNQLNKFRSLQVGEDESGTPLQMADNYRPVQALNGRVVTKSFMSPDIGMAVQAEGAGAAVMPSLLVLMLSALYAAFL